MSKRERKPQWDRLYCSDGFNMSVQAGQSHYSNPRSDVGPWTEFEVGYPSDWDVLLAPYAEDPAKPTETIYGYVPLDVVEGVVRNHGGLRGGGDFPWV